MATGVSIGTATTPPFAIFGRLEVRGRSGPLAIGGRRRRQLLAYLLVHANTRCSVDRICDEVWDGAPPGGAVATVRTYVSQYRRFDVEGEGLVVVADPFGYEVRLARRDLDAARFEDQVVTARRLEALDRLQALEGAFALWAGDPLAEFTGAGWADAEASRLQLLHEAASKDRFDVLLELGRHEGCVPELERALAAAPLDERFTAQLAIAYYRSGRVADALRQLGDLRRRLGEELGLSPGADIVDLEHRMLERDEGLDIARHTASLGARSAEADSPRSLPIGTVTFLFTDIEGSTRMLRELGDDAYADVLATQRALVAEAVQRHGGIVVGMEGDSHFCAFASTSRAAHAAIEAQQALRARTWPLPLRVRMGLHAGEALVVGADYVGTTVHVAARIGAAAHGGQVVASDACRALAAEESWSDLGWHRLKDVDRAHHLFELDTGDPDAFPPLKTAENVPNNLPVSLDVFVGREADRRSLAGMLEQARLVTIVGPGGIGKTRLSIEAARDLKASNPGGAYVVPLAQVTSGEDVGTAITRVLLEAGARGSDLKAVAAHVVGSDATLLVVDNCEHVLEHAASVVADLLADLPALRVVATSREPLHVRGERVLRLEPLQAETDGAVRSPAEELFVARAEAATGRPVAAADAAVVRDICTALDGLPLAIELAASRASSLAIVDIAARLGDRFSLLRSGRSTDDERHRTLEAVVAWSYELLTPLDRALFNRLSVFGDAFNLEAAEAVAMDVAGSLVLDGLGRLVDKSLVQLVPTERGSSYLVLDTLRTFGRGRLAAAGALAEAEERLLDWAMSITSRLECDMRTERQDSSLSSVVPHRGNLRTALHLQLARGRVLEALRIVASVPVDTPGERMRLIDALLPEAGQELDAIGRAHLAASNLEFERARFEEGVHHAERAAVVFTELGDDRSVAWASFLATFGKWGIGDTAGARTAIESARTTFADLDDRVGAANAAWVAIMLHPDVVEAERLGASAEADLRAIGSPFALAHCLEARALVAVRLDRTESCGTWLAEALGVFAGSGNTGCIAHCLEAVAAVLVTTPDADLHHLTAELLGAAEALRISSGHRHRPWELEGHRAAQVRLGTLLDPADLEAALRRGQGHHVASAVELASRALSAVAG